MTAIAAGPPVMRSGHEQPLRLSSGQVQSMLEMETGPSVDAPSALLADYPSNTVLWSKAADEPLPMASTTKLMTALLALNKLPPDEIITAPAEALVGGASMGLEAGELVGVETLLYGALLPSGNDAAMTLAIRADGSEADFVERMNAEATAWGLTQTNFVNPHGFDAPGHVSSARDLMSLARRVLDVPLLAQIVRTAQATVGGYQLVNTNELLTSYPGAYGVKTGTTDEAGEVLIAGAARTGGNALTVVMNSPDRYAETQRLLDFYFDHWQWSDPRLDHDALNRVTGPDGAHYLLRSPSPPSLPTSLAGAAVAHVSADKLRRREQAVGRVPGLVGRREAGRDAHHLHPLHACGTLPPRRPPHAYQLCSVATLRLTDLTANRPIDHETKQIPCPCWRCLTAGCRRVDSARAGAGERSHGLHHGHRR